MNMVRLRMVVGNGSSDSTRPFFVRGGYSQIPVEIRKLRVLTVLAAAFFFVGGVSSAAAQTSTSAKNYLKHGIERYLARDFEAAIADFSEAIAINSGLVKLSRTNPGTLRFNHNQRSAVADDGNIVVADAFNALAYY